MKSHGFVAAVLGCAACFPLLVVAQPSPPDEASPKAEQRFNALVDDEMNRDAPKELGRFLFKPGDWANPVLHNDGNMEKPGALEEVPCDGLAALRLGRIGLIRASLCKNGLRVRKLSALSIELTQKNFPPNDELRKAGVYHSQEIQSDGSELLYFPVVLVGHGFAFVQTLVLYDQKLDSAIVVQSMSDPHCPHPYHPQSPFCNDIQQKLTRVAKALRDAISAAKIPTTKASPLVRQS
jgi:hypothetical protein